LYGRAEMLELLPPVQTGGSAITRVTMEETEFMPPPVRFEPGTQPVSQVIGLAAAVDFLTTVRMDRVAVREHELIERLVEGIKEIPGVLLLGPADTNDRVALASVSVDGLHAHDVGQFLD